MKKKLIDCDFKNCFLCRSCIKEWIPAIQTHKKTFFVKKGTQLFQEGDPVEGIFFVFSGTVKVHKHWGTDKELIMRFARKGDIVGHRGLGLNLFYPISATAIDDVSICFVSLDFFQATLKTNHELLYQLMQFYASELQESEKKMRNLAHMPVKGRIIQSLLFLRERFGLDEQGSINLNLSRQDLASYVGATYETVFRFINELSEEKLIRIAGKKTTILQHEELEKELIKFESLK